MRRRIPIFIITLLLAGTLLSRDAAAEEFEIDTENSLIAVITHKAGIIALVSHNHLIYAQDYDATLNIDGDDLTSATFRISFPTKNLVVSDNEGHERWNPAILRAGILEKPLEKTSPKNRAKIREHMLSQKQLHAKKFPKIAAKLTQVREDDAEEPGHTHTHLATLELTLHGQTVTHDFPTTMAFDEGVLHIEALVTCNFSDFGIKPYSALGGAIKNQDFFHFYINLRATSTATTD